MISENNQFRPLLDFLSNSSLTQLEGMKMLVEACQRVHGAIEDQKIRLDTSGEAVEAQRQYLKSIGSDQRFAALCNSLLSVTLKSYGKDLILADRLDESVEIFEELLELTEGDILGARYYLPGLLVATGRIERARKIVERYRETSGPGLFNLGLVDSCDCQVGFNEHIIAASARNPHIAHYLVGKKSLPEIIPDDFDFKKGSKDEGIWYAGWMGRFWHVRPASLECLRAVLPRLRTGSKNLGRTMRVSKVDIDRFSQKLISASLTSRRELLHLLVSEARFIFDREPWHTFNEQPVFVHVGDRNETIVSQFSGALGNLKGAHIYTSVEDFKATNSFAEALDGDFPSENAAMIAQSLYGFASNSLWLHLENIASLPPPLQRELKPLCLDSHRKIVPAPQMKRRGFLAWLASEEELLAGLIGLFGLFVLAGSPRRREDCEIHLELSSKLPLGKTLSEALKLLRRRRKEKEPPSFGLGSTGNKLEALLSSVPVAEKTWEIGVVGGLGAIQENMNMRPSLAAAALVVDQESGLIVGMHSFSGGESLTRAIARALLSAVRATHLKPRLVELAAGILNEGIVRELTVMPVKLVKETPKFDDASACLLEQLEPQKMVVN